MTVAPSVQANRLLDRLQRATRLEPNNVREFCEIGSELLELGIPAQAAKCYAAAVEALRRIMRSGDVDLALKSESLIYDHFILGVDEEQHYARCFADWKNEMAALGRRHADLAKTPGGDIERVAFFLHTGHALGHSEVLLKLLESRRRTGAHRVTPFVYILHEYDPGFVARLRAAGAEVVLVGDALGLTAPLDARFRWMRETMARASVGVCVWVSVPTMAAYAFATRLAPVQIFWAMRFHPLSGPDIDGYISWGAEEEVTRRYGEQDWEVVPLLLALDDSLPARGNVEELRSRFPERVLLGTLARVGKINSAPFLKAVADTLAACPDAGFVWTGRNEHPGITGFFRDAGVAERCHFVGWVDTRLYAAALDVFLDTFPHGCGVTSYQAFAAGTPLLSHLGAYTIFGTYFWHLACAAGGGVNQPRLASPDLHPILCARDPGEFTALAVRLAADPAWRATIGARGRDFFRKELASNGAYSERFFATVARIANSKLRRSATG